MTTRINVEEHIPALTRFAISLTKNRDAANDLVQDTVMKVLTRDAAAEHVDNEKSYLMSTLHNLFIDSTRRGKRMRSHVPIDDFDTASNDAPQNLALTTKEVVAALDRLPDDARFVLTQLAREGMSYGEIAESLHIPVGTVMSRISRARAALRSELCGQINDCEYAEGIASLGFDETGF